jgi:hypothetical protein
VDARDKRGHDAGGPTQANWKNALTQCGVPRLEPACRDQPTGFEVHNSRSPR